ncbi:MAG: YicC/YloC family endoribonuclease [Gammaproteobacteria bacterium]
MITSMTGFSRSTQEANWGHATFEIRSVNHRFLELSFKWPDWCRGLEDKAKELIKSKLTRGKVDVFLNWQPGQALQPAMTLNTELVGKISQMVRGLSTQLPNLVTSAVEVLRWPDVVRIGPLETSQMEGPLLALLEQALLQLVKAREREGQVLARIIDNKSKMLLSLVEKVLDKVNARQTQVKGRLLKQIGEIQINQPERLEQELVFLLHRLDISEELDRLKTHCESVLSLLEAGGQIGRRLDFIMQELSREANTLSAKSGDMDISELAIDMKVLIEQMREQIQNIE